jgi:hypothetical protein
MNPILPKNPTVYRGYFFVRVITFIFMLVVGARSAVHLSKAPRHLASSQCLPGHKKSGQSWRTRALLPSPTGSSLGLGS